MIGGFTIGNTYDGFDAIVVRGIGPSLSAFGVTEALQDPTIEIYDSFGVSIASDDDWQDSQSSDIEAEGLAPSDSRESAILTVVLSGAYTVILRGANNTTGVGLVETYNAWLGRGQCLPIRPYVRKAWELLDNSCVHHSRARHWPRQKNSRSFSTVGQVFAAKLCKPVERPADP
jgi:hypothetical protein